MVSQQRVRLGGKQDTGGKFAFGATTLFGEDSGNKESIGKCHQFKGGPRACQIAKKHFYTCLNDILKTLSTEQHQYGTNFCHVKRDSWPGLLMLSLDV